MGKNEREKHSLKKKKRIKIYEEIKNTTAEVKRLIKEEVKKKKMEISLIVKKGSSRGGALATVRVWSDWSHRDLCQFLEKNRVLGLFPGQLQGATPRYQLVRGRLFEKYRADSPLNVAQASCESPSTFSTFSSLLSTSSERRGAGGEVMMDRCPPSGQYVLSLFETDALLVFIQDQDQDGSAQSNTKITTTTEQIRIVPISFVLVKKVPDQFLEQIEQLDRANILQNSTNGALVVNDGSIQKEVETESSEKERDDPLERVVSRTFAKTQKTARAFRSRHYTISDGDANRLKEYVAGRVDPHFMTVLVVNVYTATPWGNRFITSWQIMQFIILALTLLVFALGVEVSWSDLTSDLLFFKQEFFSVLGSLSSLR